MDWYDGEWGLPNAKYYNHAFAEIFFMQYNTSRATVNSFSISAISI